VITKHSTAYISKLPNVTQKKKIDPTRRHTTVQALRVLMDTGLH